MNFPPLTAAAPIQAVQPTPGAEPGAGTADAFQAALHAAGQALSANADAVSRLLSGVDGFRLREAHIQDAHARLSGADTPVAPGTPSSHLTPAPSASVSAVSAPAADGAVADPDALRSANAKAMGVMMETYNFALQTSLVTNAATTFTSSINTLIKTQ